MASKWVKVLDNGRRTIVDSKRKRVTQCRAQIVGASNKSLAVRPSIVSASNTTGKRKRTNGCRAKRCSCSSRNILKNYSNFVKSGLPQRLLFSEDGQWNDFSPEVVELVKEDFRTKKAAIEVKINGCHLMFDILNMMQVDLKTGLQKPIAWIDEAGACFFPELYSGCHESHECNRSEPQKDLELDLEPSMAPEIKLHVEIELLGLDNNDLEECVEESNVKRIKVDQEGQKNVCVLDNDSCNQELDAKVDQHVDKIQQDDEKAYTICETVCKTVDPETVRKMLIMGVSSLLKVDIIDVKKCSGSFMEARLALFQKQVEVTEKLRGNANVQYAWLASSSDASSGIIVYGLGHNVPKLGKYGYGVHLSALQSAHSSATICDVDEKGVRHMVLCRVILGNTELVHPGTKQFYPSDESFDSGVDDLQNPNHYVVWNTNMSTHIHPEYLVSFKVSPGTKGNLIAVESRVDMSRVTTTQDIQGPLHVDSSSSKLENNCLPFRSLKTTSLGKVSSVGSSTSRAPRSPWMPFSMLFEAISSKVAPSDMKLVNILYDSFKNKKMSREEFIRKLRTAVGDQILRTTIAGLQSKQIPNPAIQSEVKNGVQEI